MMVGDTEYQVWYYTKMNYGEWGELPFSGKEDVIYVPFTLVCDLDTPLRAFKIGLLSLIVGICTLIHENPETQIK